MSKLNLSYLNYLCLVSLLILVGWIRINRLDHTPPGFFVDESSIAYNAYSIALTGSDETGTAWPTYFRAFGEYKNPLYIYSQVPFVVFLGPTIFASRLTAAFWGFVTASLVAGLLYSITKRQLTALFTAVFLLFNPTHLILSRTNFEVILFPVGLLLSAMFVYRFSLFHRPFHFYSSAFFLALTFYTYTSGRFLSVILFIIAGWLFRKQLTPIQHFWSWLIFGVVLLPAFGWEFSHPGSLSSRFNIVSVFNHHSGLTAVFISLKQYFQHFLPHFLFQSADGNLRHSLAFHSMFMWISAPLLAIGLIQYFTQPASFNHLFYKWLIAGLILSPIPSALTIQSPHVLRSSGLLVFITIFVALGFNHISTLRPRYFTTFYLIAFFTEAGLITHFFFTNYPLQSQPWYESDTVSAMEFASSLPGPYFLSDKLYPGSYITWAFIRNYPPTQFQKNSIRDTQPLAPHQLSRINSGTAILDRSSCLRLPAHPPPTQTVFGENVCVITF